VHKGEEDDDGNNNNNKKKKKKSVPLIRRLSITLKIITGKYSDRSTYT